MNIKLVRLITGEDIVCEFKQEEDHVQITNPLMLYMQPGQQSAQPKVGLVPWMHYSSDKDFLISNDRIVVVSEPVEELSRQYDSIYGAGLILPKSALTA
jgi:hypothetical protein